MTREECITTLKAGMELFLFDPATGENIEPDSLNELDRITYAAMEYAVEFMEARPRDGKNSYFYTFGTDPQFPFGIDAYVEIHADTANQADQKFKIHFPCREGSSLLNCAFVYSEETWNKFCEETYGGKKPARVID